MKKLIAFAAVLAVLSVLCAQSVLAENFAFSCEPPSDTEIETGTDIAYTLTLTESIEDWAAVRVYTQGMDIDLSSVKLVTHTDAVSALEAVEGNDGAVLLISGCMTGDIISFTAHTRDDAYSYACYTVFEDEQYALEHTAARTLDAVTATPEPEPESTALPEETVKLDAVWWILLALGAVGAGMIAAFFLLKGKEKTAGNQTAVQSVADAETSGSEASASDNDSSQMSEAAREDLKEQTQKAEQAKEPEQAESGDASTDDADITQTPEAAKEDLKELTQKDEQVKEPEQDESTDAQSEPESADNGGECGNSDSE